METICKLFTQTCCFCYRCQRVCNCGDFCYKIDKHFIEAEQKKEQEQVKFDWQKVTIHHNLGRNASCERDYYSAGQVYCTDKAIYIKTNPSPFCGLFCCFKICGQKCYSCCCNIGIPTRIPLDKIQTCQAFKKQPMDMNLHLACGSRTYDKATIQMCFYSGNTITLIMDDKFDMWEEEFPKLVTSYKSNNPQSQEGNVIEITDMQQPLMEAKCVI